MLDVFIPSYHRPTNIKTVKYLSKIGYDMKKVHVFVDDEADDIDEYRETANRYGFALEVFDMKEARKRYDYVHRASVSRRSAGQARNMFFDYAKEKGIVRYVVMDDDTNCFQYRVKGIYKAVATPTQVLLTFELVARFCEKHHIGLFGLSQTGDFYSNEVFEVLRKKVMNTTFYDTRFIYRGERGVQDDDTSQFVGVHNEGLFTGSIADGCCLQQTVSATAKGGLTDLYEECKLYNKAMVTPIQFPTAIRAERQVMNGNRLHHKINYRYLTPKLLKGKRNNIAWDTYPEDYPFTNEPKRSKGGLTNLTK